MYLQRNGSKYIITAQQMYAEKNLQDFVVFRLKSVRISEGDIQEGNWERLMRYSSLLNILGCAELSRRNKRYNE